MTTQSTARLEARLPADVYALLKRAAEIEGRTLTDFVVAAASAAARKTLEELKFSGFLPKTSSGLRKP